MNIIVCVDDDMGMTFNQRRVSRDEKVTEKVVDFAAGKRIWMNDYSLPLFEHKENSNVIADGMYLDKAEQDECCFVEKEAISNYKNKIDKIILFRWNRSYPSDMKFDIDLSGWKLNSSEEFAGNSHECITMEVYSK